MTHPAHTPHPAGQHPDHEALLHAFGLTGPDPQLDAFATQLAQEADAPYAMVNIFGAKQQFFGLHTPHGDSDLPAVGRTMPLDHGFCPEVVRLKIARVLPDVFSNPRSAGNPVTDLLGIRTYAGAPLLHRDTVLGTVCFVGLEARELKTGRASLELIKRHRDQVMDFLHQRAGITP
ncbi:GAF domain-containing protein [Streptomyces lavenduligriseus]|uniref:GAF domain-containing protein n=1 Tax=Streptomyces lavenduligriseus TaxID=67315 RepID=A0ABT0P559_9ACTN|nr:GAF domain-containing protein [Streptomyces lavenduligriseus]MCL3998867.1 GAF domain-containing protein [Streptomyces lavenduligriseus]